MTFWQPAVPESRRAAVKDARERPFARVRTHVNGQHVSARALVAELVAAVDEHGRAVAAVGGTRERRDFDGERAAGIDFGFGGGRGGGGGKSGQWQGGSTG